MGKQWLLFKGTGDGGCPGTATKPSSTTTQNSAGKSRKKHGNKPSFSGGCMNAIFHLFDIQHHHFPFHQPPFISESSISITQDQSNLILKGVEAPRNSLEEEGPMVEEVASSSSTSSSSKPQKETNFNIPMGGIQIKTKRSRLMDDASSECSSSSPGTKTPSLVARLMGLDLLPENSSPRTSLSSPRPSSSSSHATPLNPLSKLSSLKNNNTRSLPATPRISTAARLSTEADYHHRHSLQGRHHENTSEYAKQIAQQVRENISRRIGADITNTVKTKEQRRDEFLVVLKPKRPLQPSAATAVDRSRNLDQGYGGGKENEPIPLSCSPRLRLFEINNNLNKPISILATNSSKEVIKEDVVQMVKQEKTFKIQKCKRTASEKYDLRFKKMNQQEEKCAKKICNKKKSTPLSNHLVNVVNTTKFISFKKDMASPSSTTLSQKQMPLESITQLPSCQSRSYNTTKTHKLSVQSDVSTNGNRIAAVNYFEYISRILSHSGIEKTTVISITHWYSPSHPLHPSILERLNHHPAATSFADRKLIYDVTDELLVEILKPYISLKPWALGRRNPHRMYGSELVEKLCEKIRCFPAADCKVLEDIDGLIEGDMRSSTRLVGDIAFEEEAEELVAELERDIVDTFVGEMAAGIIWHVGDGGKV